MTVGISLWFH